MKNKLIILIAVFLFPLSVFSQDEKIYLDEFVVEEASEFESDTKAGFNTVITREDIERSSFSNLFELLENQNSVSLRSDTGSEKFTTLDIRGMGETAGSNVLVLLDGKVINSADMSGQGLNDIPLHIVESVEILRGSGGVSEGGGAVGGVIKINTLEPVEDKAVFDINFGSYSTSEKSVLLTHKDKIQSIYLNTLFYDTDGYRDNGFYEKSSAGIRYKNNYYESLEFGFSGFILKDKYGLPGGVSLKDAKDEDKRTKTYYPFDNGSTTKEKAELSVSKDFQNCGKIDISRSYEFKDNEYILGYSPLISEEDQKNKVSAVSKDLRIKYRVKKDNIDFKTGLDWYFDDYVRASRSQNARKNGQLDSKDIYFSGFYNKSPFEFNTGFRYSDTESKFREDNLKSGIWYGGDLKKEDYSNYAAEAGFTYNLSFIPSEYFVLISKSYRNPNIDELAFSSGSINSQTSVNYESGFLFKINNTAKAQISVFHIKTKDEIYYGEDNSGNRYNRNYNDYTLRKGIDLSLNFFITKDIFTGISATLMSAELEDTGYKIPLVSEKKVSAFAEYEAFHNFIVSLNCSYYSEKKQGGDIKNQLENIPSYYTADIGLKYKKEFLSFYLKANNIFNENYITSAYENSGYPMPGRNFTAGVKAEF